jgi:hypothetical protein
MYPAVIASKKGMQFFNVEFVEPLLDESSLYLLSPPKNCGILLYHSGIFFEDGLGSSVCFRLSENSTNFIFKIASFL